MFVIDYWLFPPWTSARRRPGLPRRCRGTKGPSCHSDTGGLPSAARCLDSPDRPTPVQHERILSWNTVFCCTEAELGERINVKLDYAFGNDKLATRPAAEYPPQLWSSVGFWTLMPIPLS